MIAGIGSRDSIESVSRSAMLLYNIIMLVISLCMITISLLIFKDRIKEMKYLRFINDK